MTGWRLSSGVRTPGRWNRIRRGHQLHQSLAQNVQVMPRMTHEDESQGTYADVVTVGDAGSHPGFFRQVAEERERRQTDLAEFFNVTGPGEIVRLARTDGDVLIELDPVTPGGRPIFELGFWDDAVR